MSYQIRSHGDVQFVAYDSLSQVRHGFSLRKGGVSAGHCASLNFTLNTGDSLENVVENYRLLSEAIGVDPGSLCLSKQVHGTVIEQVDSRLAGNGLSREQAFAECDGLITDDPAVTLVTFYADCCPVMVYDPVHQAVGAAHAGWKGTASSIGSRLVEAMADRFGSDPQQIRASIGPCIGQCCFETHADVPDVMREQLGDMVDPYVRNLAGGKYKVDLIGINRQVLLGAGLRPENISVCDLCTCCNEDEFYSHRRNGLQRGSMVAVISCCRS